MSVAQTGSAGRLRDALARSTEMPVRAIGAVNAIAAHVASAAGFDALWVSGLEVSASAGLPDANVIGVRDLVDVIASLRRVADLPIIVDIDNGGGSSHTAQRYAHDLLSAGAAALCLEDSAYPKCNSFSLHTSQALADPALVCDQLTRMSKTVGDAALLIARTEALIAGESLQTAIDRAYSYAAAGANVVIVHSKDRTGQETIDVARAWKHQVPLAVIPTAFPQMSSRELATAGFALTIYANQLSRAAIAGMRTIADDITHNDRVPEQRLPPVGDLLRIGEPQALASL